MNQLFYLISRYRQQKPCYVYRLVMDNTMERKIYDRQISKEVETDGVKSLVGDEEDMPPKDFDRNVIKTCRTQSSAASWTGGEKVLHKNLHSTTRSSWKDKSRSYQKKRKKMRRDVTSKKNRLGKIGENF